MNSNKKMAAVQDETTQIAAVNTYKNTEDDENEIDLLDMGMALLEKLPYIILCFLIGAVLFNAFAYFLIKPTMMLMTADKKPNSKEVNKPEKMTLKKSKPWSLVPKTYFW
jgi:LPS O-antigen subunit length determinant protein (WzzB/FepE family)